MTDAASSAALTAGEKQAAEAVLTRAWGARAEARAAEMIWDREHVLRLELADGRSVVLKRRGDQKEDAGDRGFETELAALELLSGMPASVAPRLLGADAGAGILIMEDLGRGVSLADLLLTGGRERAEAGLIAYARALGSMHAWTIRQAAGPVGSRARQAMGRGPHDQLSSHRPEVRVPEYPALARPGSEPVPVPDWWPPRPGQKVDP
jgi:hypothetical protein